MPEGWEPLGPEHRRLTTDDVVEIEVRLDFENETRWFLSPSEELVEILGRHKDWIADGKPENDPRRADLSNADLRYVYFEGGVNLSGAKLFKTQIQNAYLKDCDFREAHLGFAAFDNSYLAEALFCGANLSNARLRGIYAPDGQFQDAELFMTHMQGAKLRGAQFQRAQILMAHLEDASLDNAQFQNGSLSGSFLYGALFFGAQLQSADLSKTFLQGAYFYRAQLQGADLQGAHLEATQGRFDSWNTETNTLACDSLQFLNPTAIDGAQIAGADFSHANLNGVDFTDVDLCTWSDAATEAVEAEIQQLQSEDLDKQTPISRTNRARLARLTRYGRKPPPKFTETRLVDANLRGKGIDFGVGAEPEWANSSWWRKTLLGWWINPLTFWRPGKPIFFDDCLIERTRLNHNVNEPWHILKRNYTGYTFFLILLAIGLSLTPYAMEALTLKGLEGLHEAGASLEAAPEVSTKEVHMLGKMLGFDKGIFAASLTCYLLAFAALRGYMTMRINELFRNEQSSGYTPPLSHYLHWWRIHRWIMAVAAALALFAGGFKAAKFCMEKITVYSPEEGEVQNWLEDMEDAINRKIESVLVPNKAGAND